MAAMIGFAIVFQEALIVFMKQPVIISHSRFVHIAAVTLFFANAVIGMLWVLYGALLPAVKK